jgi:hypothetical protein
MKRMLFVTLLMLSGLLFGCSQTSPFESPEPPLLESPLEAPSASQTPFDSPLSPTSPAISIEGPAFEIEEPVLAGALQVRGKGPYNIPIVIVNVTMAAEPLGSGIITSDGTFSIDVPELIANHRIGIMAGVIKETPVPSNEAYIESLEQFGGEGYMNLPHIGVIFASSLVKASP